MIGQTVAHYRITAKLGAGGMGVVYKATDLKLERTVALKFLPHDSSISEEEKERVRREARAASALDHANIGVIYGLEESAEGEIFIAMGYYEGETLAQKIARGLLPVSESVDIAMQIAAGLAAAHARNIVHRDIKPSNIIITNERAVKIVDFGLARLASSASATQSITTTGTLPYMAPEQILGEGIDQRTDVWALGVILVQMLTGSHPFLRPNTGAITFAILNQPPSAIDAVMPLLQPIVLRALSKQPANRYAGGREMLGDLEAARAQLSGSLPAADPATSTRAVDQRELQEYLANATTPRWTGPNSATGSATPKNRTWLYAGAPLLLFLAALGLFFLPAVRQRIGPLLASGGAKHIAVLPFDVVGNDPADAAVADGLMDSLTGKLSNLDATQKSLWVVPASVVRSRKVNDPASAFRDLGATMVVKGKMQRIGTGVQLTVDLIDAKDLRQIGSATLEDPAGDLSASQNDAVARLGRMMNITVSPAELKANGNTSAPTAYEAYLKALGYMQRYDKPGNLDMSISALQSALEVDPRFALGYATLGEAYRLKNQVDPNPKWIAEASSDLQRASQMDSQLPSTYVSLGRLHSGLQQNELALQEFQKALALDTRDADAMIGTANVYERLGRLKEAEDNLKRAAALRPDYWDGYNSLGAFYERQQRYADAIAQYKRVVELTPDNATGYSNLGGAYLLEGGAESLKQAEIAFRKSLQLTPTYAAYANLGVLFSNQKRYAESVEMTRKALQINDTRWDVWDNLLQAYLWLGDQEQAREVRAKTKILLEQYVKDHPQDANAVADLASFYADQKQTDKAITEINGALALAPQDSDVLAYAATVYDELGDRPRALQYARDSLKNGLTLTDMQSRYGLRNLAKDKDLQEAAKK